MIRIYKNKSDIPNDMTYIQLNDIFFNENTCDMLDDRATDIALNIDGAKLLSKYKFQSKFQGDVLNIDHLSAGCKTVLNVMYNPDKVFWLMDCGENALEILYGLEKGNVYCETPMMPFEMPPVEAVTSSGIHVYDDYEELKEWWSDEK